jgi:hypothetical protein
MEAAIDDDVGDDLLRLIFISCHPVLSREVRVALTLRLLGGLIRRTRLFEIDNESNNYFFAEGLRLLGGSLIAGTLFLRLKLRSDCAAKVFRLEHLAHLNLGSSVEGAAP